MRILRFKATRWLQRASHTRSVGHVIRNGFLLFLKNATNSLVVLGTSVAAAHFLSETTYGTYKYLVAFGALAFFISLSASGKAVVRTVAKYRTDILGYMFCRTMLWSVLPITLLCTTAAYYAWNENYSFAIALAALAFTQSLYLSTELYRSHLNGLQRFKLVTSRGIISSLISGNILFGAFYLSDNVPTLIIAYGLGLALPSSLWFYLTYRSRKKDSLTSNTEEVRKETITYATHLSAMNVLGKIAQHLDSILVFQWLGPASLALYSFAKTPVEQIRTQRKIIANLAAPRFSGYSERSIRNSIHYKAGFLFLMSLLIVCTYIVIAPLLFATLFPKYLEAVLYSQILAIGLLNIPGVLYIEALTAKKATHTLYILNIFPAVLKIVLLLILLPLYGLTGLLLAVIIPRTCNTILAIILYERRSRHEIS